MRRHTPRSGSPGDLDAEMARMLKGERERLDRRICDVAVDHCADHQGEGERTISEGLLKLLVRVPPAAIQDAMVRLAGIFAPAGPDAWRVSDWPALHAYRAANARW